MDPAYSTHCKYVNWNPEDLDQDFIKGEQELDEIEAQLQADLIAEKESHALKMEAVNKENNKVLEDYEKQKKDYEIAYAAKTQQVVELQEQLRKSLQELEVQQPLTTEENLRIEELYFILAI